MNGQQDNFWNFLAMYAAFLQIMDYNATMEMSTNDELMAEMKKQDSDYLQKIIRQNERIIELLEQKS